MADIVRGLRTNCRKNKERSDGMKTPAPDGLIMGVAQMGDAGATAICGIYQG
jgi:hypothetical protein